MKKILVNQNPWQTRIALTKEDLLQNIYFAAHVENPLERAFFKGIVTKVLPGIQTAFVDIGQEKAGFLHISEIDRELAIDKMRDQTQLEDEEQVAAPIKRRPYQPIDISSILTEGSPILVQVSKEPVYEKGAKLTTCFTLPGRFIVLMPNIPRIGISKKIDDREERIRLRTIIREALPEGMGAIIRTTCDGQDATDIQKDINFLLESWGTIQSKFTHAAPKEKIYEDIELPLQIVRDHLDKDVQEVIVDDAETQKKMYQFVKSTAPTYAAHIKLYTGIQPLFEYFNIEKQIDASLDRKVSLKSGGSLIIESTEAMCVVDVNTGKFTGKKSLEDTILKTNLEAAEEIVRQLRLRNIGGLIVIDFIDMATAANRQKLFKFFEKTLREQDKFQSVVLKISEFGLVQMTRKRSGKTLIQQLMETCNCCKGLGVIKSLETESYAILRSLKETLTTKKWTNVKLNIHESLLSYLTETEYNSILDLEKHFKCNITLVGQKNFRISQYKIEKN